MTTRAIMVLGTSSHVGKSLMVAALCRIFSDQGVRVAPFKSQNMSLNSAATLEGLEIGRAQALQAEAARVPASVHMNPILLKPSGNMTSQVVVRGKIWGQVSASDYHRSRVEELLPLVAESYQVLAADYELIVLEGAGSPAEINLKQHDIVNMRMADIADAKCLLVGDIDRGGVFASLLGTIQLLEPAEQDRIRGFIINKFRGDVTLLDPGIRIIEERITKPCLGVVPYIHGLALEEEDSLGLPHIERRGWEAITPGDERARALRIAVIALPYFSNFTDFDVLQYEPSVRLHFCDQAAQLAHADIVILPGSKQTVEDMLWMQARGLDQAVTAYAKKGLLVGICGGMQMLGCEIADPQRVEHGASVVALGLLPFTTCMHAAKITKQISGRLSLPHLFCQPIGGTNVCGYEIHVGETHYLSGAQPFAILEDGRRDGCISANGHIWGTYLHGIFDDDNFRQAFLSSARDFYHLDPAATKGGWRQAREESIDSLASVVRASLDCSSIFQWAGQTYRPDTERRDTGSDG